MGRPAEYLLDPVLVMTNDQGVIEGVRYAFPKGSPRGYLPQIVNSSEAAVDRLRQGPRKPRVAVLDEGIPFSLDDFGDVNTLVISDNPDEDHVIDVLNSADQYLLKPFHPRVLTATIHSLMKFEKQKKVEDKIRYNNFELDRLGREVFRDGRKVDIRKKGYVLLEHFLSKPQQLISYTELSDVLLGEGFEFDCRESSPGVVRVGIQDLRRILDDPGKPSNITNVRGKGYVFGFPENVTDFPPRS